MASRRELKLNPNFLKHVSDIGLTDSAVAAVLGVSEQAYQAIKTGEQQPTLAMMANALRSGLADAFTDVAYIEQQEKIAG